MKQKTRGFTLLELMITVAIIGIIAAIAYPSYQEQVKKSRRADAQAVLMSLSNVMERFYTQNNTFAGATLGDEDTDVFPDEAPLDGSTKHYNLAITAQDATGYTLCANPKGAQDGDGGLQLVSTGVRTWFSADDCTGTPSSW